MRRATELDVVDMLESVIFSIEEEITPTVTDPYAASQCKTSVALLRSSILRVRHEGPALAEDLDDLRAVLTTIRPAFDGRRLSERIDVALAADDSHGNRFPALGELTDRCDILRDVLAAATDSLTAAAQPAAGQDALDAIKGYLGRHLARQRSWLVEPFQGDIR